MRNGRFGIAATMLVVSLSMIPVGAAQGAELQWFGQAAVRIVTPGGKVIVIDPFITRNPKTPPALKDLGKLGGVDLILLTHGHGDHIGDTVALAGLTGAKVALNADLGRTFAALGWLDYKQMIRFNKGGTLPPLKGTPEQFKAALGDFPTEVVVRQPGETRTF